MRPDLKRFVASTSVVLLGGLAIIAAQATRPEAAMRSAAKALLVAERGNQRLGGAAHGGLRPRGLRGEDHEAAE